MTRVQSSAQAQAGSFGSFFDGFHEGPTVLDGRLRVLEVTVGT